MSENTELPENIRIPLHGLQADVGYMFGRVSADGSVSGVMADHVSVRLKVIEKVALDWHEALIDALEYFESRADADCDQDGFIPNKEMQIASMIKHALGEV